VLQNINRQGQSGVLEVRKGLEVGRIHIRDGEAINASLGEHGGKKAFYRIIGWDEGVFQFREEDAGVETVFQESTIRLILDGVKQLDEIRRLEGELFPEDAELFLTGLESGSAASHFPPQVSSLFELIREHSLLQEVVDASPLDDYKIYSALALLIGSGIVEARSRTGGGGEE
jgi:hypothetical protein